MKTILAPVDFSNASTNALAFAAELSMRSSARLVLVNIIQKGEDEDKAEKKLKSVEAGLKKSFDSEIKCESVLAKGNLITALKKIIEVQQPDLIVMGTKGASGLKKLLIGSKTVNVISKNRVPVLVIPVVARFKNFFKKGKNRIVLATDLDSLENEGALDILKEIGLLIIEPKLRVLSVRSKNAGLTDVKREERDFLLSVFNPEIESERVTIFSNSVIGGINFYPAKENGHRIVGYDCPGFWSPYSKTLYKRNGFTYPLPLLVLHDTKFDFFKPFMLRTVLGSHGLPIFSVYKQFLS
jgi:nucleotide-binding universal stress UspA family protein